jgi:hypothetical protein
MYDPSGTLPETAIDSDDEPLVKKPATKTVKRKRILSDDEDDSELADSSDSDSEPGSDWVDPATPAKKPAFKPADKAVNKRRILSDDDDEALVDPVGSFAKLSLEFDVPNSAWRLRYIRTATGPIVLFKRSATECRVLQAE